MNLKIWIPLSAAAVTGAAAAWAGYQLVSQRPEHAAVQQMQLAEVFVAARALPAGTMLTDDDLKRLRVERGGAPDQSTMERAALVGRVIATPVAQGQMLAPAVLAERGAVSGLSATLPKGFRAITVKFDRFSGLGGFLRPEARIDIVAALGSGDNAAAKTIAQNVRVLAVLGRLQGEPDAWTGEQAASAMSEYNVTLMVTPAEAAAIELALDSGSARLLLRAANDDEPTSLDAVTLADLRGGRSGAPVRPSGRWNLHSTDTPHVSPNSERSGIWGAWFRDLMTARSARQSQRLHPVAANRDPAEQPGDVVENPTHTVEVIRGSAVSHTSLRLDAKTNHSTRPPIERALANTDLKPAAD